MEKLLFEKKFSFVSSTWEQQKSLGELLSLKEQTILYFYPKDNTPWCSVEARDFTCMKQDFEALGFQIIGVSKDSIKSHEKFVQAKELDIILISDPDLLIHNAFWAYWEKKMCGKTCMGTIRSTFLLDKKGNILKEWKWVKAKGHVEKVFEEVAK